MRTLKEVIPSAIDLFAIEEKRQILVILKDKESIQKAREKLKKINTSFSISLVLLKDVLNNKKVIITYSLENLDHTKKTLFGYALKGRGKEHGILKSVKGETLGRNNIILPAEKSSKIDEFLRYWKVSYTKRRVIEV